MILNIKTSFSKVYFILFFALWYKKNVMNDSDFKKISNVLKDYLESNLLINKKISSKLLIADKWNQIFKTLSDDVKFLDFKNEQVLFLKVSNSSILYSISINKSKIIREIKELTGIAIIDIKVLVK
ncbi:conserved hypothetical protein [Borreliella garinii PBr]|uniref:DUF721 domain-containing protein n=2 Tax=Borreliella garinii TaxID=29519 RepID=B7XRI5_BORGR|nr:conserved hypothetical protein [Borreliella garinii PBr]